MEVQTRRFLDLLRPQVISPEPCVILCPSLYLTGSLGCRNLGRPAVWLALTDALSHGGFMFCARVRHHLHHLMPCADACHCPLPWWDLPYLFWGRGNLVILPLNVPFWHL